MKVVHTVGGFDSAGGGVTTAMSHLVDAMQPLVDSCRVLTVEPTDGSYALPRWVDTVPCDYFTPLSLSKNLRNAMRSVPADILHTNGLWMHINHLTAVEARRRRIPFVLSPHGMLYGAALSRSAWKKHLMSNLWFRRDISSADAIHATCNAEAQSITDFGYRGHIEVIPNAVVQPAYVADIRAARSYDFDGPTFGFLGRLHPRKGIELLINAYAKAEVPGSRLIIMGSGDIGYQRQLRSIVSSLKLENSVVFTGHIDGREKFEHLASLTALFVPSDFENFGMIVPEALMAGTPVVAADTTPWQMLEQHNCGWWRPRDIDSLVDSMRQISSTTPSLLQQMGNRGAIMVAEHFSPEVVADQMLNLYNSLL
ncbi:MAG: glycosyltransferase [Muribaculaceae bacterium]|nr:glycosyltransferase [Muribaculaceae bacterium]